jgi:lipopolysaccharide/colanic/teichoic acid biosynthesis glycosyltransferase
VRIVDEIGMIDNQHIGVCLYDTDRTGALVFAKNILEEFISTTGQNIPYKVNVYPTDKKNINGERRNSKGFHKNNGYSKQRKLIPEKSYFLREQIEKIDKEFVENIEHVNNKINYEYKMPIWKRYMDIIVSVLVLVVASPFFLIIIMLIKIISPGPAFFKQERVGYMGRTFTMLKFRSMRVGNCTNAHREYLAELIRSEKHSDGNSKKPMTKRDNLNSLIPYGKVFRRLCLDELPQLINVIRGEMSLIGPRPPITYEVEEYQRWHNGRFDTLPGITGLWQVNGKNRLTFEQMVRLDIRYSRQESLWVDIIIILKTPFAIISNALYHKQEEKRIVKGTYKYA